MNKLFILLTVISLALLVFIYPYDDMPRDGHDITPVYGTLPPAPVHGTTQPAPTPGG